MAEQELEINDVKKADPDSVKDEEKISDKLLQDVESSDLLKDDSSLEASDARSMKLHNEAYTEILRAYKENVCENLKAKRWYKKVFFYLICSVLGCAVQLTIAVVIFGCIGIIGTESIGIYATALGTFLSSFIILPKVVAKYLFSREEETKMADIVRTMQAYDADIRESGKKYPKN